MKNSTQAVLGFSLAPTHIAAVKLSSSNFSLQKQAFKTITPFTFSEDTNSILDADSLGEAIQELSIALGHPEFSTPVYLALQPHKFGVYYGQIHEDDSISQQILTFALGSKAKEDDWIVMHAPLWRQGDHSAIAYAILDQKLIENLFDVFYQSGLHVISVDLIPFTVLRAMAASGVLDALLHKIGKDACWGCFGISGATTWVTIWQGNMMCYVDSFMTPNSGAELENKMAECLEKAPLLYKPIVWLAWQEAGSPAPINPLKLDLGTPVRQAMLGPIYQKQGTGVSLASLGAALKTEIAFPLKWDFLAGPRLAPLKAEGIIVPYVNYQPVLPKFFMGLAIFLFLACIASAMYFKVQNSHRQTPQRPATFAQQLYTYEMGIRQSNVSYMNVLAWLKNLAMPWVSFTDIRLDNNKVLTLEGSASNKAHFNRMIQSLSRSEPNRPYIDQLKQQAFNEQDGHFKMAALLKMSYEKELMH